MLYEYSGAIHMHSTFSDGSGTVDEIAVAADEIGLDYFILTDHNNMKAKEMGFEKWYNRSMLIVGYEMNDSRNKNHYLVLGTDNIVGSFEVLQDGDLGSVKSALEYVVDVKNSGGFGFIAHPHERRSKYPEHPPYPWTAWDSNDFDGIEIWNHMSEWIEGLNDKNKLQRFLHPLKSIVAPDRETIRKWDELNIERKVTGIGCIDAHAHKVNIMGLYQTEIFPYKVLFKSIRTNVLVGKELEPNDASKFGEDRKAILDALKNGRSYICNYYQGQSKGFRFIAEYDGEVYNMGDEILFDAAKNKKIMFKTLVPEESKIKFIKNGEVVDEVNGFNCLWDSDEAGAYRVEVWKGNKAWIFSNHIRVKEKHN